MFSISVSRVHDTVHGVAVQIIPKGGYANAAVTQIRPVRNSSGAERQGGASIRGDPVCLGTDCAMPTADASHDDGLAGAIRECIEVPRGVPVCWALLEGRCPRARHDATQRDG